MTLKRFSPFKNEVDTLQIGDLVMHEMAHTNLPNKICAAEPETVRKRFP